LTDLSPRRIVGDQVLLLFVHPPRRLMPRRPQRQQQLSSHASALPERHGPDLAANHGRCLPNGFRLSRMPHRLRRSDPPRRRQFRLVVVVVVV
jgi:hypothetical protein